MFFKLLNDCIHSLVILFKFTVTPVSINAIFAHPTQAHTLTRLHTQLNFHHISPPVTKVDDIQKKSKPTTLVRKNNSFFHEVEFMSISIQSSLQA